jgi:WD40 repeat protein
MGGEIARGGMGRVVRARDRRLRRDVAIKENLSARPEQIARFEREVLITARLQHPAIVPIHAAGRWPDGRPFYEMKLVSGRPLDRVVAGTRTPADRLALLPSLLTVVEALAYAHGEGIIHRDLKPSNVMLGQFGEVVVIDWGLAKELGVDDPTPIPGRGAIGSGGPTAADSQPGRSQSRPRSLRSDSETVVGSVLGTPTYMPPEQAAGRAATTRSDVYALGAMLYHVLVGKQPYEGVGKTAQDVLTAVLAGPPIPLRKHVPEMPSELVAIVDKAMARAPADRYPSAREMAEDLRRFQTGQLVGSHRYTTRELMRRWARRHRPAVVAALAVVLIGVGALVQVMRALHQREVALKAEQDEAAALVIEESHAENAENGSLQVLGVRALLDGHLQQAATYLAEVYQAKTHDPGVRFEVAQAMRGIDPLTRTISVGGQVYALAFSPDGAEIVTGGPDGPLRVWNTGTGALVRTLEPALSVRDARYCADGSRLVTAGADGAVRIWNPADGTMLATLEGHKGAVNQATFSRDCRRIVSASDDGTVRVWDATTAAATLVIPAHEEGAHAAVFSPDGTRIATDGNDHDGNVWDAASGKLLLTLAGHEEKLYAVAYRPDGAQIATASLDDTVRLWDATSGALTATLSGDTDGTQTLSYSPDGSRLLTSSGDGSVRLWDVAAKMGLAVLDEYTGAVRATAFSPDATSVAAGGEDGNLRLWSPARALLPVVIADTTAGGRAAFSPDGLRLAVPDDDEKTRILDATTGALLATLIGDTDSVWSTAFSPDGTRVVTASADGTARIWNAATGVSLLTLAGHVDQVWSASFSPDGARVLTVSADETARIWDSVGGSELATLAPALKVLSAAYSPTGDRIATVSVDGSLRVWDAKTDETLQTITGHFGTLTSARFSSDGTRIVAASSDGTARIFDALTGAPQRTLVGHGAMSDAEFSPDGQLVVTTLADGTADLWDVAAETVVGEVTGLSAQGESATFSPDGNHLAVTAFGQPTRILDVHLETRSPEAIATLVAERSSYRVEQGRLMAAQRTTAP